MKVFEFKNDNNFEFPEDMEKIMAYLNDIGTLSPMISKKMIEGLYKEYSEESCAGWLLTDDNTLEDFAQWLSKKEI